MPDFHVYHHPNIRPHQHLPNHQRLASTQPHQHLPPRARPPNHTNSSTLPTRLPISRSSHPSLPASPVHSLISPQAPPDRSREAHTPPPNYQRVGPRLRTIWLPSEAWLQIAQVHTPTRNISP